MNLKFKIVFTTRASLVLTTCCEQRGAPEGHLHPHQSTLDDDFAFRGGSCSFGLRAIRIRGGGGGGGGGASSRSLGTPIYVTVFESSQFTHLLLPHRFK